MNNNDNNSKAIIKSGDRGLVLRNLEDMYRFAQYVVASHLAPNSFQTPEQILIAIQSGAELGMAPMRSLQSFCVINGQARMWGDAALALVRQSGQLEYIKESIDGEKDGRIAICETKRKEDPEPLVTKFSVKDAMQAGLWNKKGTWQQYPERMLKYRARSFNLRDNFPDVFGGATIAEEYVGIEMTALPAHTEPRSADLLNDSQDAPESPQLPPESTIAKEQALSVEEAENNAEEMLRDWAFKCLNPKCGHVFDEPGGQGEKPLCPECLTSKVEDLTKEQ